MKIKYQLFIVLLIASALLIALMLAVNNVSFKRQFISYINSVETRRLEPLVAELAEIHNTNGNWQSINKGSWTRLVREYSVENRAGSRLNARPPPPGPPRNRDNERNRPDRPRPPSDRPPGRGGQWLTLADDNRKRVFGRQPTPNRMQWLPITTDDGTVGYLGFAQHRQFNRKLDQQFAHQQKRNFLRAAIAMVLLSALLSIPLAARIIRPLSEVNRAVGALSSGDYSYRTAATTRDEFGDLARNINRLGESLEQNKVARQRWIADISHELRTPVAVLQSELEALQDGIRQPDENTIQSLHTEILRLGRLIDDLHQLSVSDIGALDYQMSPLELHEIVSDFLSAHKNLTEAASIDVNFHSATSLVEGDAQRLNQLLNNLLQNTQRYTTAPGQLNVSMTNIDSTVSLVWEDSAPSVSDEDLQHLFEPLYRADKSRNRKTSGSGLGLAIVQKIVAAHDGHITATQSQLGGLKLVIQLPAIS